MNFDNFTDGIIHFWKVLPEAIIYLLIGYLVIKIASFILKKFLKISRVHREFKDIIESFSTTIMWVLLISLVVQTMGFSNLAVAISSSIAIIGLGIATGANILVSDIISGIYLARDKDFHVGMSVKFGDIEGEIEKIDMRKIRVRLKNNKIAVIANSNFDRGTWITDQGQ